MTDFFEEHDWKNFPELTNAQMAILYFQSPHKQITQNFNAKVTKVHDGDTVTLKCDFRNFEFPMRLSYIDAPELKTGIAGQQSKERLKQLIDREEVYILINQDNRVEKWGRLLGEIMSRGTNINQEMVDEGFAVLFGNRQEGEIPDFNKNLENLI